MNTVSKQNARRERPIFDDFDCVLYIDNIVGSRQVAVQYEIANTTAIEDSSSAGPTRKSTVKMKIFFFFDFPSQTVCFGDVSSTHSTFRTTTFLKNLEFEKEPLLF